MTTTSVALIQSSLLGDSKGNAFNDIEKVIGGANVTINTGNPLKEITVMHGGAIDGLKVKYNEGSSTTTVTHGTSSDSTTIPTKSKITLESTENIIAISGKSGSTAKWGIRVTSLSFAIYNSSTGKIRVEGPFGGTEGKAFRVTANGNFVGFGGFAVDTDSTIQEKTDANPSQLGGIYGLTFFDVAYREI